MSETDLGTLELHEIPDDDNPDEFYGCEDGDNEDENAPQLMLGFGATSSHKLCLWLPAAFDKWGVRYKKVAGWENRGRPISAGYFDPNASLTHHTGSKSSAANPAPSLKTVIEGRSDLRGPLAQVSTDYNGLTYIIAAGRANHAGKARATMGNPAGDGNAMYIGNEVQTNGTQAMPGVQLDATVLVATAIADHFRQVNADKVGLHHTTSLSGKWDLGAGTMVPGVPYDLRTFRGKVNARLKAGPPGAPTPPRPPAPVYMPYPGHQHSNSTRDDSHVGLIQRRLKALKLYTGAIDNSFGPATEAAVKKFQRSQRIKDDGWVGRTTWARLQIPKK